jgi:hypothetical protein
MRERRIGRVEADAFRTRTDRDSIAIGGKSCAVAMMGNAAVAAATKPQDNFLQHLLPPNVKKTVL